MKVIKIETTGNTTYILFSNSTKPNSWLIKKIEENGGVFTISYAERKNNPNVSAYDFNSAWDNRASLNYHLFYEI